MLEKLATVIRIPELRNKIILTVFLLAVYRLGYYIPLPIIDMSELKKIMENSQSQSGFGKVMQVMQVFSASQLGMSTVFGLGIMPYISASIIFQLLGQVYPPLERLQKEGEAGRKKLNEYTRYATVVLCFFQSLFWIRMMAGWQPSPIIDNFNSFPYHVTAALTMTAGTVFLMWIGEQIDEYGIGNGISLLIMANILGKMPEALTKLLSPALQDGVQIGSEAGIDKLLILAVLFVFVIVGVVALTQAQRRIPTQSSKHMRGRRMFGGQVHHLPLRLNQSGVMPIIFASSLLMFPALILEQSAKLFASDNWLGIILNELGLAFSNQSAFAYNVSYIILIYFFCYFWTAIIFNPKEIANNLKDYGNFIPGYRPGKWTAEYLEKVMLRITYVGAGFLSIVAVLPTMLTALLGVDALVATFFGGTSLLIAVSVALDLVQKIDSHIVMRNYTGLLEKDD